MSSLEDVGALELLIGAFLLFVSWVVINHFARRPRVPCIKKHFLQPLQPGSRVPLSYETEHTEEFDVFDVTDPDNDGCRLVRVKPAHRPGAMAIHRVNARGEIVEKDVTGT